VIARAIILNPVLLVADEPVSMLDMSVRAKILELMLNLKHEFGFTYLYITHDLATAKFFCDRIAILYLGRIVEMGPSEAIYRDPKHPYTKALLRAIPEPDPRRSVPRDLPRGEVPDAARPPLGCSFHPRCSAAFEVCGWESRDLRDLLEVRWAQMGADEYEREQAVLGDLSALDASGTSFRLAAPASHTGADLVELLDRVRADDPAEPFWRGVQSLAAGERHVDVELNDAFIPRLLPVDGVQVECNLFDEAALGQAAALSRGEIDEELPAGSSSSY
jgi:peptide/nickel transport system ATP-binding protein